MDENRKEEPVYLPAELHSQASALHHHHHPAAAALVIGWGII